MLAYNIFHRNILIRIKSMLFFKELVYCLSKITLNINPPPPVNKGREFSFTVMKIKVLQSGEFTNITSQKQRKTNKNETQTTDRIL